MYRVCMFMAIHIKKTKKKCVCVLGGGGRDKDTWCRDGIHGEKGRGFKKYINNKLLWMTE